MRPRPFERAIWGLVSEVIHSVEQPALAKKAVRVQIVQQQCKIASPILPCLRVQMVPA